MSSYNPPADKSDGEILYGAEWNALKNGLADYLNNGNIGNDQISSNPAEKIIEAKLALSAPTGSHGSRHESGGADPVQEIDILGTGDLTSAHANRHADGGDDPLPADSISGAMIQDFAIPETAITGYKDVSAELATMLDITQRRDAGNRELVLQVTNAYPQGTGVVRNGVLYWCMASAEHVIYVPSDLSAVEALITLISGDTPNGLCRKGDNIYVSCSGSQVIKKIDINNVVTPLCDVNNDGPGALGTASSISQIFAHPTQDILYVTADLGGTLNRLCRIDIDSGTVTSPTYSEALGMFTPLWRDRGSDGASYIAAGTSGGTVIKIDPAAMTSVGSPTTLSAGTTHLVEMGGGHVGTWQGGAGPFEIVDLEGEQIAGSWKVETGGDIPTLAFPSVLRVRYSLFDGKYANVIGQGGGLGVLGRIPVNPGAPLCVPFHPGKPSEGGSHQLTGLATDGVHLYVSQCNVTGGNGAMIIRMLI